MDLNIIIIVIVSSIMALVVHEFAHSLSAYFLGDDTAKLLGRLSLNPIKHIDPFLTILLPVILAISGGPIFGGAKPVPINYNKLKFNEFGFMIVAISGPLSNLLMAFFTFGLLVVISPSQGGLIHQFMLTFVYLNLGFFIFNMLPFPPLDGSRIIYPFAPEAVKRVMASLELYGIAVIFLLLILFGNYFGIFVSNFILFILNVFSFVFRV